MTSVLLGHLTRLTMLSIDGNRLTGNIPQELANLSNLRQLWLADNRLAGSVPPELTGMEDLSLAAAGNDFDAMQWDLCRRHNHDIGDSLICAGLTMDRAVLWRLLGLGVFMFLAGLTAALATAAYRQPEPNAG